MTTTALSTGKEALGSLEWLERTGGRLTLGERVTLLLGGFSMLVEGLRLRRRSRTGQRRNIDWARLEPPDTPMVRASREYLASRCAGPMVNHSYRTAFWTAVVLYQQDGLTDDMLETAWVAALLHDIGLEHPPERGDFSLQGVEVLKSLAHESRWSEEKTHQAGEAIATNLSTRVDPAMVGVVAWAMNVGGTGELGFGPHRGQLLPEQIAELERRYPRDGFRENARRLIADEARRMPDGRFALLGPFFPLIMRP